MVYSSISSSPIQSQEQALTASDIILLFMVVCIIQLYVNLCNLVNLSTNKSRHCTFISVCVCVCVLRLLWWRPVQQDLTHIQSQYVHLLSHDRSEVGLGAAKITVNKLLDVRPGLRGEVEVKMVVVG